MLCVCEFCSLTESFSSLIAYEEVKKPRQSAANLCDYDETNGFEVVEM